MTEITIDAVGGGWWLRLLRVSEGDNQDGILIVTPNDVLAIELSQEVVDGIVRMDKESLERDRAALEAELPRKRKRARK